MIRITRTLIVTLVLAGLVVAGYYELRSRSQDQQLAELQALHDEMTARLEAKEQMIQRLSRSERLAHLIIGPQTLADDGSIEDTTVELIELDGGGAEIARQSLTVPGHVVFIDGQTVRFDATDVAVGHPLRGRTLVLLRRIYSELMRPVDGVPIDTPGAAPPAYAVDHPGRFEQGLWEHFWELAADADLARASGVRVAQGEAVYKPMRTGERYELRVEAVGGLTLVPLTADESIDVASVTRSE